jgi:hypothetical protein
MSDKKNMIRAEITWNSQQKMYRIRLYDRQLTLSSYDDWAITTWGAKWVARKLLRKQYRDYMRQSYRHTIYIDEVH